MKAIDVYAILKAQGKQRFLGSMNNFTTPGTSEQADLNAFANNDPKNGDTVAVLADNSIWKYSAEKNEWFLYSSNSPIDKATTSRYGVVNIGDGINVSAGTISTSKEAIGLEKVDNVRQYSDDNPAPEKVTYDGVLYEGDTDTGVYITSNAVKHVPQGLTQAQKKIARDNIGAGSADTQVDWNQANVTSPEFIKNKPYIPEKQSDLINDDHTVKDEDYSDRVFTSLGHKNQTLNQIQKNKEDIAALRVDENDLEQKVDDEITRSTGTDNKLQQQINTLKGKTQIIGGTNCAVGAEQTTLTTYTRNKTGDAIGRPRAGDTVNIIY